MSKKDLSGAIGQLSKADLDKNTGQQRGVASIVKAGFLLILNEQLKFILNISVLSRFQLN